MYMLNLSIQQFAVKIKCSIQSSFNPLIGSQNYPHYYNLNQLKGKKTL